MSDLLRRYEAMASRDVSQFKPLSSTVPSLVRHYNRSACGLVIADDELSAILDDSNKSFHDQIKDAVNWGLKKVESPLERVLLPRLVAQEYGCFRYNPAVFTEDGPDDLVPFTVAVFVQLSIGKYRVDFALAASRGGPVRIVIVECDGDEFHDADRDAKRDRSLLGDYRVLGIVRLRGSFIVAAPEKAALVAAKAVVDAWAVTNSGNSDKFNISRGA